MEQQASSFKTNLAIIPSASTAERNTILAIAAFIFIPFVIGIMKYLDGR